MGEEVNLTFKPASITVNWSVEGNKGSVAPATGATTKYTAHNEAASANVKAEFKGINKTTTFNVVEPSGITMEAVSDLSTSSPLKAGFLGQAYILPADVNFYQILIYEGECTAATTGFFDKAPYKGAVHPKGSAIGPSGYVDGKGTKDGATDTIYTIATPAPYSNGTFKWPIPWFYKLGSADKQFTTVDHESELTVDTNGKATLTTSKGGESKSAINP